MRESVKNRAPNWLFTTVRYSRHLRTKYKRQLARIPGTHALWILSQKLRFRLLPPRTLNEKIRYRMAHDRRDILTITTDKIGVREYVEKRVGKDHLPLLYAIYENADEINLEDLPRNYVMKATHASGATLLVDERAPLESQIPDWDKRFPYPFLARVHPDNARDSKIRQLGATWLQKPYGRINVPPQWAYQGLAPGLIFEELLDDGDGNSPPDFKVLCFNGEPAVIQVFTERGQVLQRAEYAPDWRRIDTEAPGHSADIDPPEQLSAMLDISRTLAEAFDFVRVDLYAVENRVLVGELTHYPAAGSVSGGGRGGRLTRAAFRWIPSSLS